MKKLILKNSLVLILICFQFLILNAQENFPINIDQDVSILVDQKDAHLLHTYPWLQHLMDQKQGNISEVEILNSRSNNSYLKIIKDDSEAIYTENGFLYSPCTWDFDCEKVHLLKSTQLRWKPQLSD